ncbi:TetR/AcrR family transcriptional regulator [Rhodococcus sp. H36-A4]|uniref:TetR/AcrR family transcriptional regulator n=1 Tax=Rhodococcus sp. H36-A4 TaxID=3004353 RepID=UPI0022AF86D5|nr:TetR/AcrR family transcriptional regulator [Rhodococcus sp. H36-A4]MCZ4076974.1 TetR/AcrR family transcriptional regulator [Rhodococcus sp. H36-A4]
MSIHPLSAEPDSARERLMRAGETLFADNRPNGVRLRELNTLAGVRNDSAVHYYFGSREGLLEQIVAAHMADVRQRVDECTQQLCSGDQSSPAAVRDAIAALSIPYAEKLSSERGRRFIQIMARVYEEPGSMPESRYIPSSASAMNQIRRSLPDIPPDVLDERVRLITKFVIAAFAARTRMPADAPGRLDLDSFIVNLLDMATAAYFAVVPEPGHWPENWPRVHAETLD